ncbi:MAG: rod shape-determining protein MreD [Erysipelotrichia bacterium]|nr:rod shape-determining protein MreD [Erysipelotrichia bacterium]NCC54661.1 rod shape-determining protein MreD [Erysipelotrichia bacterium]
MWPRYLLIFICFLLDGILNVLFPAQFGANTLYFVSCLGFSALVLTIRHLDFRDSLIVSILFGIFYDFFYANTYFLYAILFLLLCLITRLWIKQINESMIENVFLCISTIFVRELIVYLFMIISDQTTMVFNTWLVNRMFLTLVVNGVLVLALVFVSHVVEDRLQRRELRLRREERLPWMR